MLADRPTPPCHGRTRLFLVDTPLDPNPAYNPEKAKALCAVCPAEFRTPCDEGATMPEDDYHMIRAGLTPAERWPTAPRKEGSHGPPPAPINHGTRGGYNVHRKRGEKPCSLCRRANTEAQNLANTSTR